MKKIFILSVFSTVIVAGCASTSPMPEKDPALEKFAFANCLLQYFESENYDTKSIRGISGGLVETGSSSIETYTSIAQAIQQFEPVVETKGDIKPKLNKCFILDQSESLSALLRD